MIWSLQKTQALSADAFEQWRKLLEERTGILLTAQQQPFLQSQIAIRMRELGFEDYLEYYQRVTDGIWGRAEWSVLVDRLMVKETSFFRHRHSFECVRQLLQNRIDRGETNGSFDVWSVGCSTGEEPCSLAMLVNDCFELAQLKPYYGVFATDISMPALSRARTGIFPERKVERLSDNERSRYFKDLGDGRYKIIDKLQDRLCFSQGSVLDLKSMPVERMDVIFCQNLLIYFRRWRRRQILQGLADRLKPNGLLVIGLGEMPDWKHPQLRRVNDERVQAYCRI
ncbi:CheR family methyltransferase [Gilvimarinus sp. F26214L]|uniref:CheR family methyltransferase n=1 Tax=Gilvimarinus sp. DZF01 TaxID=3461371 RepID=UPI004045C310